MSKQEIRQRAYEKWQREVEDIQKRTKPVIKETKEEKEKRIKRLLDDPIEFCYYYFGEFMDSKFAWFHKELITTICESEKLSGVAELPREHAKSVVLGIFIPMYLKAKGKLTGVVLASANATKANKLLGGLQAQLKGNELYKADFGEQVSFGKWQDGEFTTRDGIGFWAFGRGQSPRGIREGALRPNYGLWDDIDDKVIVKNPERVKEATLWLAEDLFGALSIKGNWWFMGAGNRIHKAGVLAHMVGDVEEGDPVKEHLYHLKAYAIEDPVTHEKATLETGQPAWKERYTIEDLEIKWQTMPHNSVRREYFHEHIEEGLIFHEDWIIWGKVPDIREFDCIETYTDPSFKDGGKNDFKARVTLGKKGKRYYVLSAWVRQASVKSMVCDAYDTYDVYGNYSRYWMEANFVQDKLLKDYDEEAELRGYHVRLRPDKSKKPDKFVRIENMTPLFERGFMIFDERKQKDKDMRRLVGQLLSFGGGGKDDGPDALEGAVTKSDRSGRKTKTKARVGKQKKYRNR